jgi:hypothetical protein
VIWVRARYHHNNTGTKEACMPTSGHDGDSGLLDLADLSLDDLSRLDNSVVANVIRDLLDRRRCGTESTERFNQFNSAP